MFVRTTVYASTTVNATLAAQYLPSTTARTTQHDQLKHTSIRIRNYHQH